MPKSMRQRRSLPSVLAVNTAVFHPRVCGGKCPHQRQNVLPLLKVMVDQNCILNHSCSLKKSTMS